jgi:hypothetical protein
MAVLKQPGTPGPSEFSWGEGLMADPAKGYVPTTAEQLRALYQNDQDPRNVDANSAVNYDDVVVPNQKDPA